MPAYGFKKQFVPMVEDESKNHTVRAYRKGKSSHAIVGQTVYLYTAMRTKYCEKIGEGTCTKVQTIMIYPDQIVLDNEYLNQQQMDAFAWKDGFRPPGSTKDQPGNASELMLAYWKKENSLPWPGKVIHWKLKPRAHWKPEAKKKKAPKDANPIQ